MFISFLQIFSTERACEPSQCDICGSNYNCKSISFLPQTPAIVKRYNGVTTRWEKLLVDSNARKQRQQEQQEQYRLVPDKDLTFAEMGSQFNSLFEKAEEYMADPVHCNSVEEIKAFREAHEQFKASLSAAEDDFNQLAALDKQIKSFQVGPNPYTWFTMDALNDTWDNLRKIIKV